MSPVPPSRIALVGDIHANIAALDAVLDAVADRGLSASGVCTGDIVLRGTEPDACVRRIAALGWPTVCGNTDRKVALRDPRPPGHPTAERVGSRSWTRHRLSGESVAFLAAAPLTVETAVGPHRVIVMHGSPDDPKEALFDPHTSTAGFRALRARFAAFDVVVTGHTHRQMARTVDGCLFINPGSVGEAPTPDGRPRWAWLEAGHSGPIAHLESVPRPLAPQRTPRSSGRH